MHHIQPIEERPEFALMRGRELKLSGERRHADKQNWFALMRGRELKCFQRQHSSPPASVRPHARAGVEMPIRPVFVRVVAVFALMRGRELKFVMRRWWRRG